MGSYVPSTQAQREQMLRAVGLENVMDLYRDVPEQMLLREPLRIPDGMSELEAARAVSAMAAENRTYATILRGAGAYDHYIPSIVKYIPAKEEFLTAYTPYQAEMSQGLLQSIFEYQTMICELTGMDVSNASVYDGATAAAEAAAMCRERKRRVTLISGAAHPDTINTVRTYCYGTGDELRVVPVKDGRTDMDALRELLDDGVASFYVQQPNFFGQFEDAEALGQLVHQAGARYIMGCNPIALAIMKTPRDCGADIAVGEGQPLGLPLGCGGPYLGYMAATDKLMRKLPGRIVGETTDHQGRRAYVLSLQAREQHIRREKASSNICSNEALCALTAGLYMATMGPDGMAEAAEQSMAKAHYLEKALCALPGVEPVYGGAYFHEFVLKMPRSQELLEALEASTFALPDSLGGFPQIAGMNISIDATKKYDPQTTPSPSGSGKATYYGPASINRVTINSVNGKAFDPNKTYAVVTNNFCAAGGDTYYAFAAASSQFDTGLPLDEVLMDYITTELKGVVGEQYAQPQGRITITLPAEEPTTPTKPESPKTADTGVVVYGLVAVMAAGAAVVVTSKKRKAI